MSLLYFLQYMIHTICNEMLKGNFSFAILIVGLLQLNVMINKK